MRRQLEMVRDFHRLIGVDSTHRMASTRDDMVFRSYASQLAALSSSAAAGMLAQPEDKRFIRAHLMIEELGELMQALADCDELGALDALADLLYVVLGTAVTLDLPVVEAFEEVHRSNMTKRRQSTDAHGERVRDKGPGYDPPDLARILSEFKRCEQ